MPAHPFFLDVMRLMTGPLAISSANRSGKPESKAASEVVRSLGDDVAMVSTMAKAASVLARASYGSTAGGSNCFGQEWYRNRHCGGSPMS